MSVSPGDPEGSSLQLDPDDLERIATELGFAPGSGAAVLRELERAALMAPPDEEDADGAPVLTRAGEQFLELRGDVPHDVLYFLPGYVDDLHARAALLDAGTELVKTFREELREGNGVAHARSLVPPAFTEAVDERLTYNLFAAAVALPVRLAAGDPAGCLAEEILAVRLFEIAHRTLSTQYHECTLREEDASAAAEAARGLFGIFESDEVLALFDMHEPSDALGGLDGDSRLEDWFRPSGATPGTGHLDP